MTEAPIAGPACSGCSWRGDDVKATPTVTLITAAMAPIRRYEGEPPPSFGKSECLTLTSNHSPPLFFAKISTLGLFLYSTNHHSVLICSINAFLWGIFCWELKEPRLCTNRTKAMPVHISVQRLAPPSPARRLRFLMDQMGSGYVQLSGT